MKDRKLTIVIEPELKEIATKKAASEGLPLAAYVRRCILKDLGLLGKLQPQMRRHRP